MRCDHQPKIRSKARANFGYKSFRNGLPNISGFSKKSFDYVEKKYSRVIPADVRTRYTVSLCGHFYKNARKTLAFSGGLVEMIWCKVSAFWQGEGLTPPGGISFKSGMQTISEGNTQNTITPIPFSGIGVI